MKKLLALLLALAMVFALAACGGNTDTPTGGEDDDPVTTQATQNDDGGEDVEENNNTASDEILVINVSRGYSSNDGYGFITVSFARPNGEEIIFVHPSGEEISLGNSYSMPLDAGCFSITGGFTIAEISVHERSVTVSYEATEDNYDQATSITYTPAADPLIKTTEGEAIEGFTYEVPYYNLDLYE